MDSIILYLPEYMREYKELQEIAKTENPEIEFLQEKSADILSNSFIMSANEDGISKFERMMKIPSDSNMDLESRRSRVLSKWNQQLPYTMKKLKYMIEAFIGTNDFILLLSPETYLLTLIPHITEKNKYDQLIDMILSIVPCNIRIITKNTAYEELKHDYMLKHTGVINTCKGITISEYVVPYKVKNLKSLTVEDVRKYSVGYLKGVLV